MRRLMILLAVLIALTCTVAAYEPPQDFTDLTLEQVMADFMDSHQLAEQNFSISYYNTVTGESYAFNDEKFAIAASTYKLPLNMYFYEMERDGEITGDTLITWTGQTLDYIHEQSIVNSNNELSEALMYYWGDHTSYKEHMRKYFTMTDEEIDPLYYQGNYYCVRMMMDCLHYLYDNSGDFEELLGYMKIAKPGEYFKAGVTEYEVAHKYGAVQSFVNDVGIIYTPQPFLLAVYTQGIYGDGVCAEAAKLLTAYTVWQGEHMPEPEPPESDAPTEAPAAEEELTVALVPPVQETPAAEEAPAEPVEPSPAEDPPADPQPSEAASLFPLFLAVLAILFLICFLLRLLRIRKKAS